MALSEARTRIIEAVRAAGVVGAGGAGFPTHVKLSASVDTVIANAAECEPLLASDQAIATLEPARVLAGLRAAMEAVGAGRGVVAVKRKHGRAIRALAGAISALAGCGGGRANVELLGLDDTYPVGDEHVLVYEATGRLVPEGGLPLEAGVVVSNVGTLTAIADALDGLPMTSRLVTVAGAVARPFVGRLPVGTSVADAIALAGGPLIDRYRVLMGGPIMGKLAPDNGAVITKVTSGVVVLPADHPLIRLREDGTDTILRRARAACCQCMMCTETCPRHLLGHEISPHLIMRAVSMCGRTLPDTITSAWLCSECAVCAVVGCPSGLAPVRVNQALKESMARKGVRNPYHRSDIAVHPMRAFRRVPLPRMVARAAIGEYQRPGPGDEAQAETEGPGRAGGQKEGSPGLALPEGRALEPREVRIPLLQGAGVPATPRVRAGERVSEGDVIGEAVEGKPSARVHASISGVVAKVEEGSVTIVARGDRR